MLQQPKSEWTLVAALKLQASRRPNTVFSTFHDGNALTYRELDEKSDAFATSLVDLGVTAGDRVVVFAENSAAFLVSFLGASKCRAICVPINTELKGSFLEHQIRNSEPKVLVVDRAFQSALGTVFSDEIAQPRTIVIGANASPASRNAPITFDDCLRGVPRPGSLSVPRPHEIALLMYTSGTTGPAKGVLMPHAHCYLFGLLQARAMDMTESDRFLSTMPMFHVNALLMSMGSCLISGAAIQFARRFSASNWLDDIRRANATLTNALGVMPEFILNQPSTARDRDHQLRNMMAVPISPEWGSRFEDRFGVRLVQVYGMTECNIVAFSNPADPLEPGCAGPLVTEFFEVDIVDPETDEPLAPGAVGEIVVRPRHAACIMQGYYRMQEQTVEAWRNLWFHTGDAGFLDPARRLHFVDRIRDCIRRRGENISSFEIEQVLNRHDRILESAVVGVKVLGAGGEDEVKAYVIANGTPASPASLVEWCSARMPRFAIPRFIEFVDEIEKTPSGKIKKGALRERGVTAKTWDRQAPLDNDPESY